MAEELENKDNLPVEEGTQEKLPESPEVKDQPTDQYEEKARTMGWVPQEEWEGEPDDWVSAEQFVLRKPLFDKIHSQGKRLKDYAKAIDDLKQHFLKTRQAEHKRHEAELKAARRAARADQDFDRVDEIDEQLDELKASFQEEVQEVSQAAADRVGEFKEEFQSWKAKNTWYDTDSAMRQKADALGLAYHGSGMAPDEVLRQVSVDIKRLFPEKFKNPNRDRASAVADGRGAPRSKPDSVKSSMSAEDLKIMDRIVSTGIMTEEEYLKDYKSYNGV